MHRIWEHLKLIIPYKLLLELEKVQLLQENLLKSLKKDIFLIILMNLEIIRKRKVKKNLLQDSGLKKQTGDWIQGVKLVQYKKQKRNHLRKARRIIKRKRRKKLNQQRIFG